MGLDMEWLFFGYLNDGNLWTYDGKHIGKLHNDEIYSANGQYIGELKNNNRLITNISKKTKIMFSFSPCGQRISYVKYTDYVGNVMYVGYEDFPSPDSF